MWQGVFTEFRPGLLSTEVDLDRAEAELGFALPASYRAFARECGAGRIGGQLRIATPVPETAADLVTRAHVIAHSVAVAIDSLKENPLTRDEPHRFTVEGDSDAALMERAAFFGETEGGSFLFWDVIPDASEYEIWALDADLETIHYGGPDLLALVRGLQGAEILHILGGAEAPLPAAFAGDDAEALARIGAEAAPAEGRA
ncbi:MULTISPECIES: SMI1/KNR4 family protein [Methylobacterium]|uniref:Knr4/Smi1-like domain-containing protein n=1 Tax=Methylobacterium thuringiense TaxID=1003091 RepID=A0ABQ4TKE2_9HYPH|nr:MULTISPECIES: SMI1/KNR4 family protein [Methylobacterium]TXN25043.1 SMI1/KNR4 family protein [Methylobacterium sp. WL9]GJE54739.1 hypothetical protein EKPJFOCH_1221 [Methylobacterium thuringiense]